jgi:hypothetical protein
MRDAEALAETGNAFRVHVDAVTLAEDSESGEIGPAGCVDLGESAEEVLEAGWRDDLDDLARCVACIPEGVPLVTRLEHPGSGLCRDYFVAEKRPKLPFQNVGVLVFAGMAVKRCGESPRRERMMDDRETVISFGALDLPDDAKTTKLGSLIASRWNRHSIELRSHGRPSLFLVGLGL